MKALLMCTAVLVVLSSLASCCENATPVDAVLVDGRTVPVAKTKQRQTNARAGGGSLCSSGTPSWPRYPKAARAARIQGHVIIEATIDKDGSVSELKLISGHPMLVSAAMEAVKQWKYEPYLLDGKPMPVKTTIDVNFSLSGG